MDDYYRRLGVPRNATLDQIKHAFRELQKRVHPDMGGLKPEEELTKASAAVNEAYMTLRDTEKRRAYDQQLSRQRPEGSRRTASESWAGVRRAPETARPMDPVDNRPIDTKYDEVRKKMAQSDAEIRARIEQDRLEQNREMLKHQQEQERRNRVIDERLRKDKEDHDRRSEQMRLEHEKRVREMDERLRKDRELREGRGIGGENLG